MGYSVLQNAQLHTVVYCESRVTPSCQSRAHNPFHPSRCTFQTCWCYKSCFENLQYMPFKKCDARASFEPQSTILPLSLSVSHTHTHTHSHSLSLSFCRTVSLSPRFSRPPPPSLCFALPRALALQQVLNHNKRPSQLRKSPR